MRLLGLILTLLFSFVGLEAQTPTFSATVQLRPGDAVRLQIAREPTFTDDYAITEEGVVLLPLIGLVRVAYRPFAEARDEIRARYEQELFESPVLVSPVLRIAVLGEVQQPGLFPVDPTMTVAEVVASAGGLTARGDPGKVFILRNGEEWPIPLGVGKGRETPPLQPGDQITVGRQGWFRENLGVFLTATATVVAAAVTSLILTSR